MDISLTSISTLITVIGVLVAIVNVLVEVIKRATWEKIPTNILAVVISIVLTMVTFFAYCQYSAVTIVWYMVVAAVVVGMMVAYAAMFGFDKLKEILQGILTTVESATDETATTETTTEQSADTTKGA